ncbi:hypothetical protein CLAFUW4_12567 [Fulvia fulva]|uniref:Uncharacterized protein n=1 Tax=Passalora fulva TaxID=5499 RepID=A0A9Q8PDX3_PASFU|nr:uncharacterized protein CLAFUR5_11592 [Fulvia fulva]KAK4617913.1 hypothetical protein CLAFUR4_12572 [Fulvia fulva]KAK4619236.1 hypothetical protein CLAFUR0_12583 [Fulvia fulva]UJO20683.1 hypothetical protein CLAFUR5_11592 [Fulvia fulva]WPV17839.1 hypothetical protein CLAFUW4_12567 [Fulvia fulva]WPV33088.1 hypothetical protein CLAFUW7_12574 [Fulvia fulva]
MVVYGLLRSCSLHNAQRFVDEICAFSLVGAGKSDATAKARQVGGRFVTFLNVSRGQLSRSRMCQSVRGCINGCVLAVRESSRAHELRRRRHGIRRSYALCPVVTDSSTIVFSSVNNLALQCERCCHTPVSALLDPASVVDYPEGSHDNSL